MRRLAIAAAIALWTVPAYAQLGIGGGGDQQRNRTRYTDEERKKEAEVEKAYKDAVKNTRGANSETYDPWRTIRPAGETAKKPAR
jgi:hypothetical protein